tara:strand:+ start:88 stop:564 length:477 start_codon:yes stop_codon:yes gene_type:complete
MKRRPEFRNVPIIVLLPHEYDPTAQATEYRADDYVERPFAISDLITRIRANLRRLRPAILGDVLIFDAITLELETYRVRVAGRPVHLGPKEFQLLAILMERPERVWSRESLLRYVWGEDKSVDTRSVDVIVGRVRKALGQTATNYPIRTVRGAGYAIG